MVIAARPRPERDLRRRTVGRCVLFAWPETKSRNARGFFLGHGRSRSRWGNL